MKWLALISSIFFFTLAINLTFNTPIVSADNFILSPANPASPLSPANPANPASPLNPLNQSDGGGTIEIGPWFSTLIAAVGLLITIFIGLTILILRS